MTDFNEQAVFEKALELPSADRDIYISKACNGDAAKINLIQALLAAHDEADDDFLESGFSFTGSNSLPEKIGAYQIESELGRGGFGIVYLAQQTAPIKRKVALKAIKPGMNSDEVIARFEMERQALANLDHPAISTVHDAGTTEAGQPYFVMEYVDGERVTHYCNERDLSIDDRLEIFQQICAGVQHAHQRGIIHRDLKPANILVTEHEGKPMPKIIDFGVAKAIGQEFEEFGVNTKIGQLIGTPSYMSPEQADLSADHQIDTRSDIYALGALLYELLTGSPPFAADRFSDEGYQAMLSVLREETPQRPSARLEETTASVTSTQSRTTVSKMTRALTHELDWIVMKALEKEPDRRYDTVSSLQDDVQRFLNHDAVLARPPSLKYRAGKFIRKNALPVGILTTLVLATLIGGAVSLWMAFRAWEAEEVAVQRSEQAAAVSDYLIEAMSSPHSNRSGMDVRVVDVLEDGIANLDGEFDGYPITKAGLLNAYGYTLLNLKQPEKALPLLEEALELMQRSDSRNKNNNLLRYTIEFRLSDCLYKTNRKPESLTMGERLYRKSRAFPREREVLLNTVTWARRQAEEGDPLRYAKIIEEELQYWRGIENEPFVYYGHSQLARCYRFAKQPEKAIPWLEEAIKIQTQNHWPQFADSRNQLASIYLQQKRNEAAVLQWEALDAASIHRNGIWRERRYLLPLAHAYINMGEPDKAYETRLRAMAIMREINGPLERNAMNTAHTVAATDNTNGWPKQALAHMAPLLKSIDTLIERDAEQAGRVMVTATTAYLNLPDTQGALERLDEFDSKFGEHLSQPSQALHQAKFLRTIAERSYIKSDEDRAKVRQHVTKAKLAAEGAQWQIARDELEPIEELLIRECRDLLAMEGLTILADAYRRIGRFADAARLREHRLGVMRNELKSERDRMGRLWMEVLTAADFWVKAEKSDRAAVLLDELTEAELPIWCRIWYWEMRGQVAALVGDEAEAMEFREKSQAAMEAEKSPVPVDLQFVFGL